MSFHGEPSARDRCQVQLCGYALVTIWKPADLSEGIASGGGASTQST